VHQLTRAHAALRQPAETLSRVRPQPNIFNLYVLPSVLGQFAIHVAALVQVSALAKAHMPPYVLLSLRAFAWACMRVVFCMRVNACAHDWLTLVGRARYAGVCVGAGRAIGLTRWTWSATSRRAC
jgi:hypothetical protein